MTKIMQYLRRSVKYLVYFLAIFFIIVGLVWLLTIRKAGQVGFADLFQEGSFPKLVIFFLAVAAIYPSLGFVTRKFNLNGDFAGYRNLIVSVFEQMGYVIDSEKDGRIEFRLGTKSMRFSRMYEDRISIDTTASPLTISGYRRDVERILRNVTFKIREQEMEESPETDVKED